MSSKVLVAPTTSEVDDDTLVLKTNWDGRDYDLFPYRDYFFFEHTAPFTVKMGDGIIHGNLETYTEDEGWIHWNGYGVPATHRNGKYVFPLRGIGNTSISAYNTNIYSFKTLNGVQGVRACGNVEYLLDYEMVGAGEHPPMDEACFAHLFDSDSKFDITELKLPATELSSNCYQHMCSGCTYSTPIELPATTLADYCYMYMFKGAAIVEAPSLPAETLASGCYYGMFKDSALEVAPELPAYTLAVSCYQAMFKGCQFLTIPPDLTSPYPWSYSYKEMFMESGVTKTAKWNSRANTYLAAGSCEAMYKGCTSLTQAGLPYLGTDSLAKRCFYEMFSGCTSFNGTVRATNNETINFKEECCAYMFQGCTGLVAGGWIYHQHSGTIEKGCFKGMYKGCTKYVSAYYSGIYLEINDVSAESCCESMYEGCSKLTTAPGLSASAVGKSALRNMFKECTSLTYVHIFAADAHQYVPGAYAFAGMFSGCVKLGYNASLQSFPRYDEVSEHCFEGMFYRCTSLIDSFVLSATILAPWCYAGMYNGCSSLSSISALPASQLPTGCYLTMYQNCTSLKLSETQTSEYQYEYRIPTRDTGTSASNATAYMFNGTGGTFGPYPGTPEINTPYYTSNTIVN